MRINQLIFTVLGSLCLASNASSGWIEQQDINEIKPGVTTEIDLVHRFGPPDSRLVDTRGDQLLHWTKLGPQPFQDYLPIVGNWLADLDVSWLDLSVQVRTNGRVANYMCKIHQKIHQR